MSSADKSLLSNSSGEKQRLLGALMTALRHSEMNSDQMLPAIVDSFDRAANEVSVIPLIQWVDVDDKIHSRNKLVKINALSLGGGGFHISFPLKKGDLGWIIAADRDLSLFKQSLKESKPNTGRLHKFEDAWFVPDVFRKYTINSVDSDALVIQSVDSLTRISIRNDVVEITAPNNVKIDTPDATFTGNVHIMQNFDVTGMSNVNGGFEAASGQLCKLPATTTVNGIQVTTHGHISNTVGNRTIGNMIV